MGTEEQNALNAPEEEIPENPPAEEVETPGVEATEAEAPAEEVDETPDPSTLNTEIEELKKLRQKAEEDAIYWRKQKAEARAEYFRGRQEEPEQKSPPAQVGPEPRVEDFDDYNKYVAALTDHKVKAARTQWEQDWQKREQQQSQQQRASQLQQKLQEGYQRYPDFEEVTFDPTATHITPMVVDILAECDHPADIAYHLAKNRVEGVAISRMTPVQAARAISKIEATLAAGPPPAKKTTKAPPPITPSGPGPTAPTKDPEKMSQKEYAAWRESQGARRY